ncbi:MAG: hypothetical protein FJX62_05140 [Alphaproteobacteria bacterium]|nr:hypothetical protein [Alphaproteobacteria bacterium]
MRPTTLAEAAERARSGDALEMALAEFLDEYYLAELPERRRAMLAEEPKPLGHPRLDALLGAIAEYLAHQYELADAPAWVFGAARYLEYPWHTTSVQDAAFREYLTYTSPAEFASRNIFTEEQPLRRARTAAAAARFEASRPVSA